MRLTQHAYDLAQARYRSGLANYLQVLSAEGQVLAQKQQVIQSQSRQRELRLNLIRALGGGYQPTAAPLTTPPLPMFKPQGASHEHRCTTRRKSGAAPMPSTRQPRIAMGRVIGQLLGVSVVLVA